jgi:CheY-like chemotaxis protein
MLFFIFPRHPQFAMDVIVVDDEYPLRAALRRALALEGYGVTEAASGEEAIELLRRSHLGRDDPRCLDAKRRGLGARDRDLPGQVHGLLAKARAEKLDRRVGRPATR